MKYSLVLLTILSFNAFSQNGPISDMYWNNYSFHNPAMSGVNQKIESNVMHRTQWSDEFGAPTSWAANYGMNLAGKHGLGLNYIQENIGYSRMNRFKLNYNYQFKLKGDRKLVIGTALGYYRSEWNFPWKCAFCKPMGLPENVVQLDFGTAYYGKNITAGIGFTQIPIYRESEHLNDPIHLTGNFRYMGELFSIPSFILETKIQTNFERYRQDFNVGYSIKGFLEIGVGYRTSDVALFNLTGIIAKKYRIGYSYGHVIGELSSTSSGTHEMVIGLRIPN